MDKVARLLYVESNDVEREAVLQLVRDRGLPWEITHANTMAAARAALLESRFDLIVAHNDLPDRNGSELLDEWRDTPLVLITRTLEEQLALRGRERWADDYVVQDPEHRHLETLLFTAEKTLYRKAFLEKERQLTRELRESEAQLRLQAAALEAAPHAISLSKTDP